MENTFYLERIIEKLANDLTYKNVESINNLCLFLEQITLATKAGHITLEQADSYIERVFFLYDSLLT